MKKKSPQAILLVLLVAASLCSYLYLNSRIESTAPAVENSFLLSPDSPEADEEMEEAEIILPDIMMLKKAVEIGKRFVPSF